MKTSKEIERLVRDAIKQDMDGFEKAEGFVGFSDDLCKKEDQLISEITAFYLDVQQQSQNPLEASALVE